MEGDRWRERGSIRFRLREMEREWGVFELQKEGGLLDVDEMAEEKGGVLEVFEEREGVREKMGEKKGVLKVDEEI